MVEELKLLEIPFNYSYALCGWFDYIHTCHWEGNATLWDILDKFCMCSWQKINKGNSNLHFYRNTLPRNKQLNKESFQIGNLK